MTADRNEMIIRFRSIQRNPDKGQPQLGRNPATTSGYLRTGHPLPASFAVPIVRDEPKPKLIAEYAVGKNRRGKQG